MRLEASRNPEAQETRYVLVLDDYDLVVARPLDNFDRLLLAECDGPDATIADRLLALEIIARKVQRAGEFEVKVP